MLPGAESSRSSPESKQPLRLFNNGGMRRWRCGATSILLASSGA